MADPAETPRRRLPLQALLLGSACLICCLPLIARLLASVGAVFAAAGAAALGAGSVLAATVGVVVAGVLSGAWYRARRRAGTCSSCESRRAPGTGRVDEPGHVRAVASRRVPVEVARALFLFALAGLPRSVAAGSSGSGCGRRARGPSASSAHWC
jgi:hypothetical protein